MCRLRYCRTISDGIWCKDCSLEEIVQCGDDAIGQVELLAGTASRPALGGPHNDKWVENWVARSIFLVARAVGE